MSNKRLDYFLGPFPILSQGESESDVREIPVQCVEIRNMTLKPLDVRAGADPDVAGADLPLDLAERVDVVFDVVDDHVEVDAVGGQQTVDEVVVQTFEILFVVGKSRRVVLGPLNIWDFVSKRDKAEKMKEVPHLRFRRKY